jgi:hypothetical protein
MNVKDIIGSEILEMAKRKAGEMAQKQAGDQP